MKIIAKGERKHMLALERKLHENLPIRSEEGQNFYTIKQVESELLPPPYRK